MAACYYPLLSFFALLHSAHRGVQLSIIHQLGAGSDGEPVHTYRSEHKSTTTLKRRSCGLFFMQLSSIKGLTTSKGLLQGSSRARPGSEFGTSARPAVPAFSPSYLLLVWMALVRWCRRTGRKHDRRGHPLGSGDSCTIANEKPWGLSSEGKEVLQGHLPAELNHSQNSLCTFFASK